MLPVNALPPIGYGRVCILALAILLIFSPIPIKSWSGDRNQAFAVPDWPQVVQTHANQVEKLESDQAAIDLFVGSIGPAVFLSDAASAIGAKGISPRMAEELLIPEITKSAQRMVAALAAWQLSNRLTSGLSGHGNQLNGATSVPSPQAEWLIANGPFPSLSQTLQRLKILKAPESDLPGHDDYQTALAVSAGRLAQEAGQQAMAEWWRLKTWKDRVRFARAQSRLCGTWQWVIHNHQRHHQEQKFSLLFPPPGQEGADIPGLTEIIALGDTVYLRWEVNGHTQEDSLLFSKEGTRLEGTFVNSQGGWGSISGKRTASCSLK
jgi:hypothetical protein